MKILYDKVSIIADKRTAGRTPTIYVPPFLLKKWQIKDSTRISLEVGFKQIDVFVCTHQDSLSQLRIPENVLQFLTLPNCSYSVQIGFCPINTQLSIGPILALLTDQRLSEENGFGELEIFFRELYRFCCMNGFLFFIIHLQTLVEPKEVTGYLPNDEGWERMSMPVPDVVYNRIHSRKLENSESFNRFKTFLTDASIPFFNGGFLSKWDTHTLLLTDESLAPYLPETILLQSEVDFVTFLKIYNEVFVKPVFGSQGRNICKLSRVSEGWVIEHSSNSKDTHLIETEERLYRFLMRNTKKSAYIVQRGIPLLDIDGHKTDFRVLLNKNKKQEWSITSIVARLGNAGHIVSNLAQGGEMKNASAFLSTVFERTEVIRIYKSLSNLALTIAKTVDNKRDDLFGELGIDLALDSDNHPWIIEVNSKPSKKYHVDSEKIRPSVKNIVEYMNKLYVSKAP
ncbi:YheC/YheD family endospore coat-associated protein [Bacillus cihuensis]|uniref:YheC/YheD family endospore coat-associated protein n=1 Tax=Bacillus cihuensis TaxID=1208599 RepID=UPI00048CC239|nr:YheC/YheD family protein [Bacillus cihuensis]